MKIAPFRTDRTLKLNERILLMFFVIQWTFALRLLKIKMYCPHKIIVNMRLRNKKTCTCTWRFRSLFLKKFLLEKVSPINMIFILHLILFCMQLHFEFKMCTCAYSFLCLVGYPIYINLQALIMWFS